MKIDNSMKPLGNVGTDNRAKPAGGAGASLRRTRRAGSAVVPVSSLQQAGSRGFATPVVDQSRVDEIKAAMAEGASGSTPRKSLTV